MTFLSVGSLMANSEVEQAVLHGPIALSFVQLFIFIKLSGM